MNSIHVPRPARVSFGLFRRSLVFFLFFLTTHAFAGQASLAWDPSSSSSVAGYNLYYGQASGNYSSKVTVPNQTSYTVTGLTEGQAYYFVVTARDASGNESARSNEVKVTVPSSTAAPVPTIGASPTAGNAPLSVAFTGSATVGTVSGYSWNFGDGTTSNQQNPIHSYGSAGNYTVSLTATGPGGSNTVTRSNFISVTTASTTTGGATGCPCSIWAATAKPTVASDPDTAAVNLGVKFTVSQSGSITGIRFYKGYYNTGTHVGTLWTASGQKLAEATFTNETATGWQQVSFANPVPISANTVYIASYHTNVGRYAGDNNYFANSGVDQGPLHALRSGVSGPNGVYAYGSGIIFPTNSYQASNYWVDVVFK